MDWKCTVRGRITEISFLDINFEVRFTFGRSPVRYDQLDLASFLMVPIVEILTDPAEEPKEALLLRLLHGGLNEHEIALELRGSHGFIEDVKEFACKLHGLASETELRAFAAKWCLANPLPVQQTLEVAKPSLDLGIFAVVHGELRESSCLHLIYLPPSIGQDVRQRELLIQYVDRIIDQYRRFNFTGGSTINGRPAPGWDTLKKFWPRRLLLGKRVDESDSIFLIELSYDRHMLKSPEMIGAMFVWLDAQFKEYADCILVQKPGGGGLIQLEHVRKPQ